MKNIKGSNLVTLISSLVILLFIVYSNLYVYNYLYTKYSKRLEKGKLFDISNVKNTLVSMGDYMLLSIFVIGAFRSINISKGCKTK